MLNTKIFALAISMMAVTSAALGINCRGSTLCHENNGILGEAQDNLRAMDQNQIVGDGQHITCVKPKVTTDKASLCIFYQNTGRTFKVFETIEHVQNLIDHGCHACGSDPTNPGNDVSRGMLTANMVAN